MTPKETRIVLQAFISAIHMYSIQHAHEDFQTSVERFPEATVLPFGIQKEINGLREYDDGRLRHYSNDLISPVIVKIDDAEVSATIRIKLNKEGKYIIANVLGLGKSTTYGTAADNSPVTFFNSKYNIGRLDFPDSKKGGELYSKLDKFRSMVYKSTIYSDAITFDKANGIDYNSPESQQRYYDTNTDYKEAYQTSYSIDVGLDEDGNAKVEIKYYNSEIDLPEDVSD
jgi:hypothetical protein